MYHCLICEFLHELAIRGLICTIDQWDSFTPEKRAYWNVQYDAVAKLIEDRKLQRESLP